MVKGPPGTMQLAESGRLQGDRVTGGARVNWTFTERVWIGWQRGGKVRVSKVGVDGDGKGVASMVGEGVTDRFLITFDPAFSSLHSPALAVSNPAQVAVSSRFLLGLSHYLPLIYDSRSLSLTGH